MTTQVARRARKYGLTQEELAILRPLSTPQKIQDFLDTLAINFEKRGETCRSPRFVLQERKAHCIEAALLAAAALMLAGEKPLLLDLKAMPKDDDHVVALYRQNGYWGAISKTNHAVLRFRDPVYKNVRELAMSYFHEYFLDRDGEKVLQSYSEPFNVRKLGTKWVTSEENLWELAAALDDASHFPVAPKENLRLVRDADDMERAAGDLREWTKRDVRT